MQLSPDFKVKGKARTAAEALTLADEIEQAVGQLLAGKLKPGRLDVGLLSGAVQALRDHVNPGWIDVRDRLPEPEVEVLTRYRHPGGEWQVGPHEHYPDDIGTPADFGCAGWLYGSAENVETSHWMPMPSPDLVPAVVDPIAALVAEHARLIDEGNHYAYFELAYTRTTDWMAWITDKPGEQYPDRKVLFHGQGATPEEACRNALKGAATGT